MRYTGNTPDTRTTSREAAESIELSAPTLRSKVLHHVRECGYLGATDADIQEELELTGNTQRPRRIELCDMGLLRSSNIKRITASGRSAVVWLSTHLDAL